MLLIHLVWRRGVTRTFLLEGRLDLYQRNWIYIFQKTRRLDKKRLDFIMVIANDFEIILLINFNSQSCQHVLQARLQLPLSMKINASFAINSLCFNTHRYYLELQFKPQNQTTTLQNDLKMFFLFEPLTVFLKLVHLYFTKSKPFKIMENDFYST